MELIHGELLRNTMILCEGQGSWSVSVATPSEQTANRRQAANANSEGLTSDLSKSVKIITTKA